MKKFLIRFLFFAVPVFVLLGVWEIALRRIPNDYTIKIHNLDANASAVQLLILGNSHTYFGINPSCFSMKAYNMAYVSQSIDYDYEILSSRINELKNLKAVIIDISYNTLHKRLQSSEEAWRSHCYSAYYGLNYNNSLADEFELTALPLAQNSNRLIQYYIKNNSLVKADSLGWGTNYSPAVSLDLEETGITAAYRHSKGDTTWFDSNCAVLDSMVALCSRYHLLVYFCTTPAWPSYINHIDGKRMLRVQNEVRKLCTTNRNCRYYDFLSASDFKNTDFYDADHLNWNGADRLSHKLDSLISQDITQRK